VNHIQVIHSLYQVGPCLSKTFECNHKVWYKRTAVTLESSYPYNCYRQPLPVAEHDLRDQKGILLILHPIRRPLSETATPADAVPQSKNWQMATADWSRHGIHTTRDWAGTPARPRSSDADINMLPVTGAAINQSKAVIRLSHFYVRTHLDGSHRMLELTRSEKKRNNINKNSNKNKILRNVYWTHYYRISWWRDKNLAEEWRRMGSFERRWWMVKKWVQKKVMVERMLSRLGFLIHWFRHFY